jgi:hypothetical protein
MHRFSVRSSVNYLVLLASLSFFARSAMATTVIVPSDDSMLIGARAVIRAKVLSVGSGLDGELVFTYTVLKVREVLKGRITERKIVIKEAGGIIEDRGRVVFGTPQFTPGEEVILYLVTYPDGSFHVYQMFLGKFTILNDQTSGRRVVVRATPDGETFVSSSSHAGQSRGTITDRMELSEYTAMIRSRLAANADRVRQFEETYFRDAPMLAEPPEYQGIIKKGSIQPRYSFLSPVEPARWFEPDSNQPVIFHINPNEAPNPQTTDDINAAMNAWSILPGCSLRVVNGGNTGGCHLRDQNTIVFDNCDGAFAPNPSFCDGVLALGGFSWDRSQSVVINGTRFYKAYAGHISFNKWARCSFEEHCNVRLIATHELGHALGLGHSQFTSATMFAYANFDGRCAALRQDDIDGITFIYPGTGGGGPGPLTIATTSPLAGGTTGTQYTQRFIAFGGTQPYNWTLVAGSGLLPTGLTLAANGTLSGVPTDSGSFTFSVRVTDGASGSAQGTFSIVIGLPGHQYNSQFESQTVPTNLQPSQAFQVNIKWNNTGTSAWNGSAGFRLVSQNPENNVTWGGNTVQLPGYVVPPGDQLDIIFTAFAPSRPGTYNFQWQCVQDDLFFGQMSANVAIQVGDGGGPDDAVFTSLSVATSMTSGQVYPASITVKNMGSNTWSVADYKLGSQNPQDNNFWGLNRLSLPAPVAPGGQATIDFTVTAPSSAGTYNFQWQMIRLSSGFFGTTLPNTTINVVQPVSPPVIATSTLATAEMGLAYSHQLVATGGTQPYAWTLKTGSLPGGLTLGSSNGLIIGTPTSTGSFAFTVRVTDSGAGSAEKSLTVIVNPPPPPLVLVTSSLTEAVRGSQYSVGLLASGGTPPYTWSLTGSLSPGLSLNTSTGVISGVPTSGGVFSFTIGVRDQRLAVIGTALQLSVLEPVPVPAITRVKYKNKKKLTVICERLDPTAVLTVDGTQVAGELEGNVFFVKKIKLPSGAHVIRVVNPRNTSSEPYVLNVD